MAAQTIERRLRMAGILTAVGLVVQLITLLWNQASAFLFFAFLGAPLVIAGCAVFLYSVVTSPAE